MSGSSLGGERPGAGCSTLRGTPAGHHHPTSYIGENTISAKGVHSVSRRTFSTTSNHLRRGVKKRRIFYGQADLMR